MIIQTTKSFDKDYTKLPQTLKEQTEKQLTIFVENHRHPSLRIKKW